MILHRSGGTLLLVLSVIFVLMLALLKCWKIISLQVDIQNQREKYYTKFYLTDNILKQTIDVAIKNFDQIIKLEQPVKIDLTNKIKNCGYTACGYIKSVILKKKVQMNELVVMALLSNGNETVCTIKCLLKRKQVTQKKPSNFFILGYTIS